MDRKVSSKKELKMLGLETNILYHIFAYQFHDKNFEGRLYKPSELMMSGLVDVSGDSMHTLRYSLTNLRATGLVKMALSRVMGKTGKREIYILTENGIQIVKEMMEGIWATKKDIIKYYYKEVPWTARLIKNTLSASDKILIHLKFVGTRIKKRDNPPEITRGGIADAIKNSGGVLSTHMKKLKENKMILEYSRMVTGREFKLYVFKLSKKGNQLAIKIIKELELRKGSWEQLMKKD
jgi:DNA-binding PadR family transcriptional regulator